MAYLNPLPILYSPIRSHIVHGEVIVKARRDLSAHQVLLYLSKTSRRHTAAELSPTSLQQTLAVRLPFLDQSGGPHAIVTPTSTCAYSHLKITFHCDDNYGPLASLLVRHTLDNLSHTEAAGTVLLFLGRGGRSHYIITYTHLFKLLHIIKSIWSLCLHHAA